MGVLTRSTEWEGELVRLVKLGGLKQHENFPFNWRRSSRFYQRPTRDIEAVILHQLAGPFRAGERAANGLARFATSNPRFNADGKRIGGGRGWPGCPYTFLVPYFPETVDGKLEVYRLWDDPWVTWHTGKGWNKRAVAVGFAGMLKTRQSPKWSADHARDPEQTQFVAGTELITDYLLPRYDLKPSDLMGHFDAGKVTCPGDVLEAWVRRSRGELVSWLEPGRAPWDSRMMPDLPGDEDGRPLETWTERQRALVELGYHLGTSGPGGDGVDGVDGDPGEFTASAVRALQEAEGCVPDGVWGPNTEHAVRVALERLD